MSMVHLLVPLVCLYEIPFSVVVVGHGDHGPLSCEVIATSGNLSPAAFVRDPISSMIHLCNSNVVEIK